MVLGNHAKKELVMDEKFVKSVMTSEGYIESEKSPFQIGDVNDQNFFISKFSCSWQLEKLAEVEKEKAHLITGFGPTNSPTGGTLSVIQRALFFDKSSGIDSTIIISNLGAFNSRNVDIEKVQYITNRFIEFIKLSGYNGEIRTHDDRDVLVVSAFSSKVSKIEDFHKNQEATAKLYAKMGLQGDDFGTYLDMNLTVADIITPVIKQGKERVLVFVGIEEYYFPKLAQIVLNRLRNDHSDKIVTSNACVSAIFGRLIEGLNGYPKMSKSIPESSVNLGDSEKDIYRKIVDCENEDEKVILQMIQLVSDWDVSKINQAGSAMKQNSVEWKNIKKEYAEYYINIKRTWEKTAPKTQIPFDIKESLFAKSEQ